MHNKRDSDLAFRAFKETLQLCLLLITGLESFFCLQSQISLNLSVNKAADTIVLQNLSLLVAVAYGHMLAFLGHGLVCPCFDYQLDGHISYRKSKYCHFFELVKFIQIRSFRLPGGSSLRFV